MIPGILGKKIGMTQIFTENGKRVPVTVIEAGPCTVQQVKVQEKDGYTSVQLGFSDKKEKGVKKPQLEFLKKNNLKPKQFVKELRCENDPEIKTGDQIVNSMFQVGDFVDITGISKGKGFQGGMKRCNWAGGGETHGSNSHRAPGSIGASSYPSRVHKGHPMPGHMGQDKVTVQNVQVVEVDRENNIMAVKGAVPGASGTFLVVKYALKKELAERIVEEVVEDAPEVEQENNEGDNKEGSKE